MLRWDRANRPPCATGDATNLPFAAGSFDAAVAAFCFNHLDDPAVGIREAGRVAKPTGVVLASTYAADDDHPVKAAVNQALLEAGWTMPSWYNALKTSMAAWGSVEGATAAIDRAGLRLTTVEHRDVAFPDLTPAQLVAWRFGIAHTAPFVASLAPAAQALVEARSLELLGPTPEPLVRKVIFLAATR
jgi:SAM-dependent methyltransferase